MTYHLDDLLVFVLFYQPFAASLATCFLRISILAESSPIYIYIYVYIYIYIYVYVIFPNPQFLPPGVSSLCCLFPRFAQHTVSWTVVFSLFSYSCFQHKPKLCFIDCVCVFLILQCFVLFHVFILLRSICSSSWSNPEAGGRIRVRVLPSFQQSTFQQHTTHRRLFSCTGSCLFCFKWDSEM